MNESINQSINQSISQSVSQSVSQSINDKFCALVTLDHTYCMQTELDIVTRNIFFLQFSDVANAGLISENRCSDRNLTCANGACDPLAGKCVCPRKMRADRQEGGQTRCVYSKLIINLLACTVPEFLFN